MAMFNVYGFHDTHRENKTAEEFFSMITISWASHINQHVPLHVLDEELISFRNSSNHLKLSNNGCDNGPWKGPFKTLREWQNSSTEERQISITQKSVKNKQKATSQEVMVNILHLKFWSPSYIFSAEYLKFQFSFSITFHFFFPSKKQITDVCCVLTTEGIGLRTVLSPRLTMSIKIFLWTTTLFKVSEGSIPQTKTLCQTFSNCALKIILEFQQNKKEVKFDVSPLQNHRK